MMVIAGRRKNMEKLSRKPMENSRYVLLRTDSQANSVLEIKL